VRRERERERERDRIQNTVSMKNNIVAGKCTYINITEKSTQKKKNVWTHSLPLGIKKTCSKLTGQSLSFMNNFLFEKLLS
jgi:hypothetical protein